MEVEVTRARKYSEFYKILYIPTKTLVSYLSVKVTKGLLCKTMLKPHAKGYCPCEKNVTFEFIPATLNI